MIKCAIFIYFLLTVVLTGAPLITSLPIHVPYMSKIMTFLQQIQELKEALILDNARLYKSTNDKVEYSLVMRFVGGEGYRLMQQIQNMLDEFIHHVMEPVHVADHIKDAGVGQDNIAKRFDCYDGFDIEEE